MLKVSKSDFNNYSYNTHIHIIHTIYTCMIIYINMIKYNIYRYMHTHIYIYMNTFFPLSLSLYWTILNHLRSYLDRDVDSTPCDSLHVGTTVRTRRRTRTSSPRSPWRNSSRPATISSLDLVGVCQDGELFWCIKQWLYQHISMFRPFYVILCHFIL